MNKLKISIFAILILSIFISFFNTTAYAEEEVNDTTTTTTTTQVITVINGPANVGNGTPTTTDYQCYYINYNGISPFPTGIGQDNNFQRCVLETYCESVYYPDTYFSCAGIIVPDVEVIDPPLPPITNPESSVIQEYNLPSTGLNEVVIVVALVAMAFGLMLMLIAIRKSNIE